MTEKTVPITNQQMRDGFDEVYNRFWKKYCDNVPGRRAEAEWERMCTYGEVLRKKYPFLADTVVKMIIELDERVRRKERADG